MLELKGLTKHFGGVRAVDGLDLRVTQGEMFGLIGPNGSGKSTIVNLVCGLFPITAGQRPVARRGHHRRCRRTCASALGIARTFQNIRLFGQLTVWQNLWVAQNAAEDHERRLSAPLARRSAAARARRSTGSLEFSDLRTSATNSPAISRSASSAGSNSRARFAAKPALLLLDEPAAGMNAEEIDQLDARIRKLQQDGRHRCC